MRRPIAKIKPDLKLGAEPKKVMFLGALVVVGIIVWFINRSDTPANTAPVTTARPAPETLRPMPSARPGVRPATRAGITRSAAGTQNRGVSLQEFRPTLKPKDPIDPSRVDPTLKLDLLAKLRTVNMESAGRSLFDFSAAPPAKVEIAKVNKIVPGQTASAGFVGPIAPKPPAPTPPPPVTPIPLKFYGFTNAAQRQGHKRAFFLEGEDIFVAAEGELIKNRYKVVRIGVNSADVEDTTDKHKQTLPLEAEQVSG